ncbi:polycystic kidney disease protein 1-like 2 [Episyrphus balteatus]|uniref:polycystic kidney disease protein 1-like 2 n=1 Tax=Episyrphus balteatus TaxID=286459 RepID=UPI002486A2E4|nr:polycystic kidney disease protein 1-like 2 [Episyrphus balteatus]
MKFSDKNLGKSVRSSLTISIISILLLSCCVYFIGLRYETKKLKAFVTTIVLVFIYQIFVGDIILFFSKATYSAIQRILAFTEDVNPITIGVHHRKKYLQQKICALKYELELGPTFFKRNQALTFKYKEILGELLLYGCYLTVLLILVIGTRDPLLYYNTRTIKDVLRNPKFSNSATSTILTSDDLYTFLNETIVNGFIDGRSYNGKRFDENGWTNLQISKILGVVRLRQMRYKSYKEKSNFDDVIYEPGWLRDSSLPFKDKFWRIFKPWEYQDKAQTGVDRKIGKLHNLPGGGYVTLFGRNPRNCQRVLTFLQSQKWIDSHTAVVVIEFTLYNVDADVFTLVVISAEQTGFDSFVVTDRIETLKLLFNIDNLSTSVFLTFLIYFFILTKVLADVVLKMWYSTSIKDYLAMSWNYVDITIVGLNLFIGLGVWIREIYVKQLLHQLETSRKNEFVPFYKAAAIDETCTVLVAFLVALTTLRLWKILQFAKVFRILTSTLHHAKGELASTTFFVAIFLTAVGLGLYIINGSNSPSFVQLIKSITTLLSLSFGFGTTISPSEMNYGGNVVGFIFYAMLVIAVTIFLLNMFITVVCLHFSKEKEKDFEESENEEDYSFWNFLIMEIEEYFDINLLKKYNESKKKSKGTKFNAMERMQRMELISQILDTQMKLLKENLNRETNFSEIEIIVSRTLEKK